MSYNEDLETKKIKAQQSSELKEEWLVDFLEQEIRNDLSTAGAEANIEVDFLSAPKEFLTEDLQQELSELKKLRQWIKDIDPVTGIELSDKSVAEKIFSERVFEEKLIQNINKKIAEPKHKVWLRQAKKTAGQVAIYILIIGAVSMIPNVFYKETSMVSQWSNQESSSAVELASVSNSSEVYLDMMLTEERFMTLSEVNFLIK